MNTVNNSSKSNGKETLSEKVERMGDGDFRNFGKLSYLFIPIAGDKIIHRLCGHERNRDDQLFRNDKTKQKIWKAYDWTVEGVLIGIKYIAEATLLYSAYLGCKPLFH